MRSELVCFALANLLVLLGVLYATFDLLSLAVDDTLSDAFAPGDLRRIPSEHSKNQNKIPKIIHQTYKTEDIPEHWKEGQQRCKDLHPDYEYVLWTDQMADDFIAEHYSWFLDTFRGYKFPIQRADAIRYFVLSHYGGVYIDLDDGCNRRLDPLLHSNAFLRKTSPMGVSNDVMGSIPHHPFFTKVIQSLQRYNRDWYFPYITIMSSTGPLFISMVWKQYKRSVPSSGLNRITILQPNDYKGTANSFFAISKGSSWHMSDAIFVKSLAHHILACVVAGFTSIFALLYLEFCIYAHICNRSQSKNSSFITRTIRLINWKAFFPASCTKARRRNHNSSPNYNVPRKNSNLLQDLEKNPTN